MPSYTLEIEVFGVYGTDIPSLEIWEDGVLNSTHSTNSSGSIISVTINYPGSVPTSLSLTFNDALPEGGRTIEIQSVKINDKYVNVGNYLSTDSLTNGASVTVDIASSEFIFDASEPAGSEFTTGATRTLTTGADQVRTYTGSSDEIFDALDGRDIIYSGSGNDKISGGAGDDMIRGGAGNDLLFGGTGTDRLYGEGGDDTLYGGDDFDRIHGGDGDDEIHGGAGNDRLNGNDDNDLITGGTGDDSLSGGNGDDVLFGDAGADTLSGGMGDDTLDGGADNDLIYGGGGVDIMNGGDGNDILVGDTGDDILHGDDGNDTLYGRADNDELNGGNGADTLIGDGGTDIMDGGSGNDILIGETYAYMHADLLHAFRFEEGSGATSYDELNSGNDITLTGGTSWSDTAGFDGGTALVFDGGAGYAPARAALETMTIGGALTFSMWGKFDNLNVGGEGWQRLFDFGNGEASDNILFGQVGNGTDMIFQVYDGASVSGITVSNAIVEGVWAYWTASVAADGTMSIYKDGVLVGSGSGNVPNTVSRTGNYVGDSNWAIDATLTGAISDFTVHTTDLAQIEINDLYFSASKGLFSVSNAAEVVETDILNGGDGNDQLYGNGGDDTLDGGAGNDMLDGGDGNDTVTYLSAGSGVTVDLSLISAQDTIGAGTDTLLFIENLTGSSFNDTLIANDSSNNTVNGGAGDDVIVAGNQVTVAVNASTLSSYGGSQDGVGTVSYLDDDIGVHLDGNLWKDIALSSDYTVTANTIIEFDFKSTLELELGAIGFDDDDNLSQGQMFKVYGTQGATDVINDFDNYAGAGDWVHYEINVGAYYTGTFDRLLLESDDDGGGTDGNSWWRNIVIHEGTAGDNILTGGDGVDELYGDGGLDTFLFEDTNDVDIIHYFNTQDGDILDISSILTNYVDGVSDIDDYVNLTNSGDHVIMSVDANGTTGGASFTSIAELRGQENLDEATLLADGNLVV